MSTSTFRIYELAAEWAYASFVRGNAIGDDTKTDKERSKADNDENAARIAFESLMRNA